MTVMVPVEMLPRAARRSCSMAFAIQGFVFASLITRLPTIKDRFGLSDYEVLALLGGVAVLSAIGSVVTGYAAARFGSGRVLRIALAGGSLCAVATAVPHNFAGLLAAVFAFGFFIGCVDVAANLQGIAVEARYGRSIMVSFHGAWSLGAVIGGTYAALTLELDWALLPALALVGAVGLTVNAVACRSLLPRDADQLFEISADPSATTAPKPATTVPWGPVLLLAVPTFAMWFLDAATSAWGGIYITDGLDASQSTGALAFTAYQAVLLVVRLTGDRVVRRFGPVATVRGSGLVATAALVLVAAAPSVGLVVVGFGLLGAGVAMIPPLSMVAAGRIDDGAGIALARVNVSNYLAYLVAAFAIAVVAEQVSHRAMFVLPLLVAPLLIVLAPRFANK